MEKRWMKLDTAAKVYPMVVSDHITTVYEIGASLNRKIDEAILRDSLTKIMVRFPYYSVRLKQGFFWYYLEENLEKLNIVTRKEKPCSRIHAYETKGYLFKVRIDENDIVVSFNHILGDGASCLTFLSTLLYEYCIKAYGFSRIDVSKYPYILDINEKASIQEGQDMHSELAKSIGKSNIKPEKIKGEVYHIKSPNMRNKGISIVRGSIRIEDLKRVSKKYNCSITELAASIYVISLMRAQKSEKIRNYKNVSVQIPINLRSRFDFKNMRNASLYMTPFFKMDKDLDLKKYCERMKKSFEKGKNLDTLRTIIKENDRTASSLVVKFLPLIFKGIVAKMAYRTTGLDTFSGTISNIGSIVYPNELQNIIKKIKFTLSACPVTKTSLGMVGYNGEVIFTFIRTTKKPLVEKTFFKKLVDEGIEVNIEGEEY